MSISYIKDTETKEEFIESKFKISCSADTRANYIGYIKNFEMYCQYGEPGLEAEKVILELYEDWKKNKDVTNLVNLLWQFHTWIQKDHNEITWFSKKNTSNFTKRKYTYKAKSPAQQGKIMSVCRIYLRARTGIRISNEDLMEKITIPNEQEDQEPYPMTLEQFRLVYDHSTINRRKVKYLFQRDTAARTHETVQITKSMIDFDFDKSSGIAKVTIPKKITKGKTKTRIGFLTKETKVKVKEICKNLGENDPIFVISESDVSDRKKGKPIKSEKTLKAIKAGEIHAFWRERETLIKEGFADFDKRYESGTHKIVLHSIRSLCATAISLGNNSDEIAHGYIGHKKYLEQYIRKPEAEQLEIFKKAIPYLTGITKEYGPDEISQRQKGLENQVNLLQRQLSEEKKNSIQAVKTKVNNSSKFEYVVKYLISENRLSLEELADLMAKAPNVAPAKQ